MMGFIKNLKRSLSARLLFVFIATSLLMSLVLFVVIAHGFASQWRANVRPHMEQYLDFVSAEIGSPPSIEKAKNLANRIPVNIYIVGPDINFSTNGQELDYKENLSADDWRKHARHETKINGDQKIEFSGDEDRTLLKSVVGDHLVFYELKHRHAAKQRRLFIWPALLAILGILSACFLIIRRMLKPVRDIRDGVQHMGQGNLDFRIPVRRKNDLGELAGSINNMAADIESMLDAKRQLLLGASHELRSPLTRAKIALRLMDESKERDLLDEDLQEMENLIADILESERMKSGHAALDLHSVNLPALVKSVVDQLQTNNVNIDIIDNIPLLNLDETRITILLRNLIGNALLYSEESNSPVKVVLHREPDNVGILVSDAGPGIAPHHIEHITDAFYRTDASRTRTTGGFGLGLHLAKLIAEVHGGSLAIESRTLATLKPGESTGTDIRVIIPLERIG